MSLIERSGARVDAGELPQAGPERLIGPCKIEVRGAPLPKQLDRPPVLANGFGVPSELAERPAAVERAPAVADCPSATVIPVDARGQPAAAIVEGECRLVFTPRDMKIADRRSRSAAKPAPFVAGRTAPATVSACGMTSEVSGHDPLSTGRGGITDQMSDSASRSDRRRIRGAMVARPVPKRDGANRQHRSLTRGRTARPSDSQPPELDRERHGAVEGAPPPLLKRLE